MAYAFFATARSNVTNVYVWDTCFEASCEMRKMCCTVEESVMGTKMGAMYSIVDSRVLSSESAEVSEIQPAHPGTVGITIILKHQ